MLTFVFELFDLVRGEFAGVALVVEGAEGVEPLVAEDAEPFAQLAEADPQQLGDFFTGFARGDGQDGGEALVDTPVQGFLASPFDLLALLGGQDNRFHGRMRGLGDGSFRLPSLPQVNRWGVGSPSARVQRASSPSLTKDTEPLAQLGEINP